MIHLVGALRIGKANSARQRGRPTIPVVSAVPDSVTPPPFGGVGMSPQDLVSLHYQAVNTATRLLTFEED